MVSNDDKKVSLLEENIKTKGENAYYYAHKRLVDNRNSNEEGIIISGPGIITGGDPVLLAKSDKPAEVIKENKKFTQYHFSDDQEYATVKILLPDEIKEKVVLENVTCNFTEKTLDLIVYPADSDPYYFSVKKLHKKIVPEESKYKIVKGKLVLSLKKNDTEKEWEKLNG